MDEYSIHTHANDSNLRLITRRDTALPSEAHAEDWRVATHLSSDEVGNEGMASVREKGFWLYWADPTDRECPTFPPRVS